MSNRRYTSWLLPLLHRSLLYVISPTLAATRLVGLKLLPIFQMPLKLTNLLPREGWTASQPLSSSENGALQTPCR